MNVDRSNTIICGRRATWSPLCWWLCILYSIYYGTWELGMLIYVRIIIAVTQRTHAHTPSVSVNTPCKQGCMKMAWFRRLVESIHWRWTWSAASISNWNNIPTCAAPSVQERMLSTTSYKPATHDYEVLTNVFRLTPFRWNVCYNLPTHRWMENRWKKWNSSNTSDSHKPKTDHQ